MANHDEGAGVLGGIIAAIIVVPIGLIYVLEKVGDFIDRSVAAGVRNAPAFLTLIAIVAGVVALYRWQRNDERGAGASKRLYRRAARAAERIRLLSAADAPEFFRQQLADALGHPSPENLVETAVTLYLAHDFSVPPPPSTSDFVEHARYREHISTLLDAYRYPEQVSDLLESTIVKLFAEFHRQLPHSPAGEFTIPAINFLPHVGENVTLLLFEFFEDRIEQLQLFSSLRETLDANWRRVREQHLSRAAVEAGEAIPPHEHPGTPQEIVDAYFGGTPLRDLYYAPIPFGLPQSLRFEHTHIVAGSGHGKTQLLQHLIVHDLAQPDPPALVVIDSQGDMIAKLQRLIPDAIVVDPRRAPQLNIFDIRHDRLQRYGAAMQEQVLNGAIDLYDYVFGSLLGAELTSKQSVFFRYSLRLLLALPQTLGRNATIIDLLNLMEDPRPYLDAMDKLPPIQRRFFENEKQGFFAPGFKQTKEQISYRLSAILENDTFARMLSAPRNQIDMFGALNAGKVILVNTAKDFLKAERSSFLGRLFISLTMNAAFERAAIPERQRRPAFLYIDEASEYFDDNIDDLLIQARKFNLGVMFSHQYLDQCTPALRSSIASNTSIKLAGGVSDRDARALAADMRTSPDFILAQHKDRGSTQFACALRGLPAVSVNVPFGTLEAVIRGRPESAAPPDPEAAPAEGQSHDLTLPYMINEEDLGDWLRLTVEGRHIRIKLPDDLRNGETLRVTGQGREKPDGSRGDLYVIVTILPSPEPPPPQREPVSDWYNPLRR